MTMSTEGRLWCDEVQRDTQDTKGGHTNTHTKRTHAHIQNTYTQHRNTVNDKLLLKQRYIHVLK